MVRDRDPGLWKRFLAFAHKAPVNDFTIENDAFIAFETFGAKTVPNVVTRLGVNSGQGTLIYALDLACDLGELAGLDDVKLLARVKKSPRPIRRIKSNAAPILLGLDDAPVHTLRDFTRAEWLERAEKVRQDPEFVQRLLRAVNRRGKLTPISGRSASKNDPPVPEVLMARSAACSAADRDGDVGSGDGGEDPARAFRAG